MSTALFSPGWTRYRGSLPAVTGAVYFTLWVVAEAGRPGLPVKVVVLAMLAASIGLSTKAPLAALALLPLAPAVQLLAPQHDSSSFWPAYAAAAVIVVLVGWASPPAVTRLALGAGILFSALLGVRVSMEPRGEMFIAPAWLGATAIALFVFAAFVTLLAVGPCYHWLREHVVRRVLASHAHDHVAVREDHAVLDALSPREREVFHLLAQGMSNAQIAAACYLSESTVKSHVRAILRKLELRSRGQVVVYAYEHGVAAR